MNEVLEFLPAEMDFLSREFLEVLGRVSNICYSAQDYPYAETKADQLRVLKELRDKITAFRDAMAATKSPIGAAFLPIATKWLEIAAVTEAELHRQSSNAGVTR